LRAALFFAAEVIVGVTEISMADGMSTGGIEESRGEKEERVKKLSFFLGMLMMVSLVPRAQAQQQFDVAFGLGTITTADPPDLNSATLRGGAFPAFSGDFLFKHNLGIQGEVAWRASRAIFQGFQPYRPILYDFNGIYAPSFGKRFGAEVMGGIGALSTRVYQQFQTCNSSFSCTNYTSSNHLAGHVGGGLKFYVTHSFFVRPEAHYYFIRNNDEFGVGRAARYGLSIGYTMRNEVQ
jgi:hypothetical protein